MRQQMPLAAWLALVLAALVAQRPHAATGGGELAACGSDDVPGAATLASSTRTAVTGVVVVGTWGVSACRLHTRLSFAVKRFSTRVAPGGAVRGVKGNPGVVSLDRVLQPGDVLVAAWRWHDWCGAGGRFQLQPSFRAWPFLAVPTSALAPPACVSRTAPSTLVRMPVRLRRCLPSDYALRPGIGGGYMQSLILNGAVGLRAGRRACLLLRARVTLALQELVGAGWSTLAHVTGNPSPRTIGSLVARNGPASVFWAWRNWCGGSGRFRLLESVDGRAAAGAPFTDSPVCADPTAASTLAPSYGHA